ncbi:MAG: hypothetical protein JSS02_32250, partial [Planctomycetes bacterium]|nr:hypothetical protein [Planctomycetota bacterium]
MLIKSWLESLSKTLFDNRTARDSRHRRRRWHGPDGNSQAIIKCLEERILLNGVSLELAWAEAIGSADFEMGTAITNDNTGNVYTSGVFSGTGDFDPG